MEYARLLNLNKIIDRKSVFLFGPRQTGKTYFLKKHFANSPFYNLLLSDVFLKISQQPQIIRQELFALGKNCPQPIIIDEIQKLPVLLDEVQFMIEEKGYRFILTGSSARKLKRGGANLLGGRARMKQLFPLVSAEIKNYDLLRILNFGSLPSIYDSPEPALDLADYLGTYLKEEIYAEGIVRKVENFSRFLQRAALSNAQLLNFASIASDAQMPPRTVIEYFDVLQDTLVGALLEPYTKSKKRKAISTAKFYFFDVGVSNFLAGRKGIQPRTELFGDALEHFIFTELRAYLHYHEKDEPLNFWRSTSGYEVDFLVGEEIAIEVKGTHTVANKHLTGLKAFGEEKKAKKKIVVSLDSVPRKINDIEIWPVAHFLEKLWSHELTR